MSGSDLEKKRVAEAANVYNFHLENTPVSVKMQAIV